MRAASDAVIRGITSHDRECPSNGANPCIPHAYDYPAGGDVNVDGAWFATHISQTFRIRWVLAFPDIVADVVQWQNISFPS
jgi:hypothetical protein